MPILFTLSRLMLLDTPAAFPKPDPNSLLPATHNFSGNSNKTAPIFMTLAFFVSNPEARSKGLCGRQPGEPLSLLFPGLSPVFPRLFNLPTSASVLYPPFSISEKKGAGWVA